MSGSSVPETPVPFSPEIMERLCRISESERRLRDDPAAARAASLGYSHRTTPALPDRLVLVTRQQRFIEIPSHRHQGVIELMYVVQGSITHHIDGAEILLQPGDVLMMNQYTVHSMAAAGAGDIAVSILIQPRFFPSLLGRIHPGTALSGFISDLLRQDACWNQYLHFQPGEHLQIRNLMEMLVEMSICQGDPETSWYDPPEVDPEIMQTLMSLLLVYLSRSLPALSPSSANNYDQIVAQTVLRYISDCYQTATLQEAAHMLNQSPSALSRQIRRSTGRTFRELLQERRFNQARTLLMQTDLSAGDIAAAVGYENTSYFYRRFRELYGVSPAEYRQTV